MGYMGFGMQKWIYTKRPRKTFEGIRKDTFAVSKYTMTPAQSSWDLLIIRFGLIAAIVLAMLWLPDRIKKKFG